MGELAAKTIFSNDTGPLAGTGLDTLAKNQAAILELEGAQAPISCTIATGSISPTASYIIVDTEGSAAADDLDVISPVLSVSENLHDGMILYLKAADSGRVVTVKNSSSANGINTYDGNDYVLSATHWLKLQLRSGKWYEVEGREMVVALAAASAAAAASTPATTTSRGIARVATLADMEPGAVVENGPAVLTAGSEALDSLADLFYKTGDLVPSFATTRAGFLLCNGGEYSRVTYAELFAIIGTAFGSGDGTSTFNVPDFRGKTIQGANDNLMAVLAAGLPNATGMIGGAGIGVNIWGTSVPSGVCAGTLASNPIGGTANGGSLYNVDISLQRGNPIFGASTTVQPPAIAANIFIKF